MDTNVEKIKHADMVRVLAKSGESILRTLNHMDCHLIHMAIGISGEVDELTEVAIYRPADTQNIKRECGDVYFYNEGLRQGIVDLLCQSDDERQQYLYHQNTLTRQFNIPEGIADAILSANIQAGIILDYVKKKVIYRQALNDSALWQAIFQLEVYLENILHFNGMTKENALDDNIEKLSKRYKEFKYSDQQAKDRNDEKV